MRHSLRTLLIVVLPAGLLMGASAIGTSAQALDLITQHSVEGHLEGAVVADKGNGGIWFLTQDGRLQQIPAADIETRKRDDREFAPLDKRQLATQLLRDLPAGFKSYAETKHYLFLYDSPLFDARLAGSIAERLYAEYFKFWKQNKWELEEPKFPLVVVVFANPESFLQYEDGKRALAGIDGYYGPTSNQAVISSPYRKERDSSIDERDHVSKKVLLNRTMHILVHECAHQLAFNSGLHRRHEAHPAWVVEGIAQYFAGPPSASGREWKGIGQPDPSALGLLKSERPMEIKGLISDTWFDTRRAEAYAQAWALNEFLLRNRRDAYFGYLRELAKARSTDSNHLARIATFEKFFGQIGELQQEVAKDIKGPVAADTRNDEIRAP